MGKQLESVLFDRINGAVAFFDTDGLLIKTNAAWEMMYRINTEDALILTYDDLVERLNLEPATPSEMMHVMKVTFQDRMLLIRRQRIILDDSLGMMVEIEDISSITKKIVHTNRIFSDAIWKIRSRISSVQNVLTLFTDYQKDGFNAESLMLLKKTRREVWEMMRYTENLRYLSAVDSGTMSLEAHPAHYSVKELVDAVVLDCGPLISAKDGEITINVDIDADLAVFTDRLILMKVISVLTFNAIEYNDGQIRITIKVVERDDCTEVSVTDNGWGIAASEQSEVFSYGFRGMSQKKTAYCGSGVELYLARKLLTILKGDLSFVSKESTGSTFTLALEKSDTHEV